MAELVDALVRPIWQHVKVRSFSPYHLYIMKVTVENKKGLNKDVKVFIDKKTMSSYG